GQKIDSDGELEWSTIYSEADDSRRVNPYALYLDSNKDLIIPCYSLYWANMEPTNNRITTVKINHDSGDLEWNSSTEQGRYYVDSYLDESDELIAMNQVDMTPLQYNDIDILIDVELTKINDDGAIEDAALFKAPGTARFEPHSLAALNNGTLVLGGHVYDGEAFFGGLYFFVTDHDLAVDDCTKDPAKKDDRLGQNYPNPFRYSTTIPFKIGVGGKVRIDLYDLQGRKLKTLVNDNFGKGKHEVKVHLPKLSKGIYLYRL